MAQTAYASGTGNCTKCGLPLLQIEGTDHDNGQVLCMACEGKRTISSGPVNDTPDIGEERLSQVLAAAGIRTPGIATKPVSAPQPATKSVAPVPVVHVNVAPGQSFEHLVGEALKIMENLPMPKDIRQFKSISKVIVQMKNLLGEKNG